MRKLQLQKERLAEEAVLVAARPDAATLLEALEKVYAALKASALVSEALDTMRGIYHGSTVLAVAHALHEGHKEASKPDDEREVEYRARNVPFLIKRLSKRLADLHPPHEAALLRRAVRRASPTGLADEHLAGLDQLASNLEAGDLPPIAALSPEALQAILSGTSPPPDDAAMRASEALYSIHCSQRDATKALLAERDQLIAKLLEMQKALGTEAFYPDANGCLRLSAGHVEGYQASDAVQHTPVTTLAGLVDKHIEAGPAPTTDGPADVLNKDGEFACPSRLVHLCNTDAAAAATPVCLLYSTDTVGGNSGSPVLDAHGRFVAINFDRQRLGLMNEFKWSASYSRSIGTDVRFILLLVGQLDGARWLVDEMTR